MFLIGWQRRRPRGVERGVLHTEVKTPAIDVPVTAMGARLKNVKRSSSCQRTTLRMGPGTTIAKRTSSMKTDTTAVPVEIPQDIIEETLSHLGSSEDEAVSRFALLSCSLVSKSWVTPCRRYLFRTITLSEKYMKNWIETFPVPEKSPAHHARKLRFWYTWPSGTPEGLFGYIPWFKNVREVAWGGHVGLQQLCRILSLGNLSQSVVSLCIDMDLVTASQIRDVIEMLPNLYDLGLLGSFAAMGTNGSRGIGAAPKRKFGGQLELHGEYADADIINMLLEVPTGLHFTGVLICSPEACLLSAVRLAEACGENLTKLTYIVEDHGEFHPASFPGARRFANIFF